MNTTFQRSIVLPAVTLLLVGIAFPARATTLTFDTGALGDGEPIPQSYGDNVTSTAMGSFAYGADEGFTPNVSAAYTGLSPNTWSTGFGDLTNVLYEETELTGLLEITLAADPGYEVRLHSFDLGAFSTSFPLGAPTVTWRLFDSADTLLASRTPTIDLRTHTSVVFGAAMSDVLRLEVDTRNLRDLSDAICIDNVTFSQVANVPEPSAAIFAAAGSLCLVALGAGDDLVWQWLVTKYRCVQRQFTSNSDSFAICAVSSISNVAFVTKGDEDRLRCSRLNPLRAFVVDFLFGFCETNRRPRRMKR